MSTQKGTISGSTAAASMMSKPTGIKITSSTIDNVLKDDKVDKHIKLETFCRYLEQIKHVPNQDYMKEAKSLLYQLILAFKGDKEYFLPWVRFLDIAHVHKVNRDSDEEETVFQSGIEEIIKEVLFKDQSSKSIDWRIARKLLSLKSHFSFTEGDLKYVEEGILRAFKGEINIALNHLLWEEESLFVNSVKTTLISLHKYFDMEGLADQEQGQKHLLEAVLCGRFDKEKFGLKDSLIIGEDGGLYLLLNRMNQEQQDALVAKQIVTKDYLKDKIRAQDKGKGDKIVLGTGGFGTVRFALSLFRSKSFPAELVCVKKSRNFQDLGGSYKPTPLEQITASTFDDYFTNDRAQAIYSPFILDMALVTAKNVVKDETDHRKGYLMMEILPQNTATRIFADERYQKWEYQKPYLLNVFENTLKLLESDIAMTDLKPDNTLYDNDTRKATIIDLGGSVKVANSKEIFVFDMAKYSFQSTPTFRAPELEGSQGIVNMHKSLSYSCGKVIEAITQKSDYDQQEISQLIKKLTASEPEARISIPEAISEIKRMGADLYRKNIIFSHYISKIKERLKNKKSAISINEDIDKTEELLITLNSTSLDPSKYKDLQTEDLFKKIDDFLSSGSTKQVMAVFGGAGSGKSIALQLKFIKAVHDWKPEQPLPIYFNLANGLDLDQIVRTLNTELDTNLTLDSLDGQHFYIDSFDEGLGIEHKRETLLKEYFRKLGSPKILITCRTDYLQDNWHNWFSPESKEFEVCYVTPIDYNGHQDLSKMVEKYVNYSKQHSSVQQRTTQEYLDRLQGLELTGLINTGFMFFLVMEVLFQLQIKTGGRISKVDIYASYISHSQNTQIAKLKNEDQKKQLTDMIQQADLCSFTTELGKYLACQMHLMNQARLGESDKLFAALGYDDSLLLKHQNIIHLLKLLPLKIVTTHSGKRIISDQEVKIGFLHETIKNYYLLEAIKSEIEREGKSLILASKSIINDSELVKLIVLAIPGNPQLTASFLSAIENSKQDKSIPSIISASNSISLLVAAKHSFSGCDLSNITVKGANIVNGIFQNANLDRADLSGVDLSNVNLTGASLHGADMRGVNFSILPDLVGHTSWVESISFSPDGKFLASGSQDQTIKIWDLSTNECMQTLKDKSYVKSVSFSPDGQFLASGSQDYTINIWNPKTGECLQTFNGHTDDVTSVSFSVDGEFLASGSNDKTIKIWNPKTGECLQTLNGHTDDVNSVSFSPYGKLLASGSEDYTIKIWDRNTGECLRTLKHTGHVKSVSFSPDGQFLASGSWRTINIWNSSTGVCLRTLKGHTEYVGCISFSHDGKLFASGSKDKAIKIWNSSTGECLHTLNGHTDYVSDVKFSPNSMFLVSGSNDQTIKIWNSSVSECLQVLNGHTSAILAVDFFPNGKFLASKSNDTIMKFWNPSNGECLLSLEGYFSQSKIINFSPDGRFFANVTNGSIRIYTSSFKFLRKLEHNSVKDLSFSPDSKFLASGSEDSTIKIWDLSSYECIQTLNGHTAYVSFSPDGRLLGGASTEYTIKIWSPSTGECLQTLKGHTNDVTSISFSPDCALLASGSFDCTIKIWNSSNGECLHTLTERIYVVASVSFSPDGAFLASGSFDCTIKIWNPSTGKCLHTLREHAHHVNSVNFSRDGKYLVSGSTDTTIKIFEFDSKSSLWLLKTNITSSPSPLFANGATLNGTLISHNNRLILKQKRADTTSSIIDNTTGQIEPHRDTSIETSRTANQFSQEFLEKFIAYQQGQGSKLVPFGGNPDELPANISMPNQNQNQNSKSVASSENPPAHVILDNPRSDQCCQLFVMSKIIYDNPLLNNPTHFAQLSQCLGSIQALKLSNKKIHALAPRIDQS